ncbi:MAG: WbqC family protein [Bernardetiaceae bacterium]
MKVSINQPAYLPWLGYFNRIDAADRHIILDHVQFEKNSFTNRNKILTSNGPVWLTVPVQTKGKFGSLPICELAIDNRQGWKKKHLKSIAQSYTKTPFFENYFPEIELIYTQDWQYFIDLVSHLNTYFMQCLGITTPTFNSQALENLSAKSDLVLELCLRFNAETYLSGALGRNYLQADDFDKRNIKVLYDNYQHPTYPQKYAGFHPYMCVLDLLFNHGPGSLEIIRSGRNFVEE